MPTQDENNKEVCKFAAGYVPSPLHCGCPECCPALARADAAKLVEMMIHKRPWSDNLWARAALSVAARAIRRGRHLTEDEKMANLKASFAETIIE